MQKGNQTSINKKFFYRSAIDNALKVNQVSSVKVILEYIIKHQNSFSSNFLFFKNFQVILEKGLEISDLLNTNIFNYEFDYDGWPTTHNSKSKELRPYNDNFFDLRDKYEKVFPEY